MEPLLAALCDEEIYIQGALRWLWFGTAIGADLWDHDRWQVVVNRHVTILREAGALSELPHVLDAVAHVHLVAGELAAATSVVEEARMVCEATGTVQARLGPLGLAAMRGDGREAQRLLDATMRQAVPQGQGAALTMAHYYHALLCNSLAQYTDGLAAAQLAASHPEAFGAPFGLLELVEAAVRSGAPDLATLALEQLAEATAASGTDWALGAERRSRALLNEGDTAEKLYREAIDHLARTRVRVELARAHLVYGEWLRREQRRADARAQLRTAYEMFAEMGVEAFADRAGRELQATGETARRRVEGTRSLLTPQEAQVAQLARDGLSNPEIGARLFISPRTAQYHLHKVFAKLDITSRNQLSRVPANRLTVA
jgi:DNA-binding CsgD family transcriptional regulator